VARPSVKQTRSNAPYSALRRAAGNGGCAAFDVGTLCFDGTNTRQPRFAPIRGITMNNATLGRLIDRGKKRSYIGRVRIRRAGAFAQTPNPGENATVSE